MIAKESVYRWISGEVNGFVAGSSSLLVALSGADSAQMTQI